MFCKVFPVAVLLFCVFHMQAQVRPAEGRVLHYRVVGFEFPAIASGGKLEIAYGNDTDEVSFKANIISSISCKGNRVVAEVPAFGKSYTWRVIGNGRSSGSILHHFSTLDAPVLDSNQRRMRIEKDTHFYKEGYIFVDFTRTLYDLQGKPTWYLPALEGFASTATDVRDIKITSRGTITFLSGDFAFEINYDGDLLWFMPRAMGLKGHDVIDGHFHHELTRFRNGHYMALGNEFAWLQLPSPEDNRILLLPKSGDAPDSSVRGKRTAVQFGTIAEYDKDCKLIWSWRSAEHFDLQELFGRIFPPSALNLDLHSNAFYFDEANKVVYASFKNISQVVKIRYPSGEIIRSYGHSIKQNGPNPGDDLFCDQHSCRLTHDGLLSVFNNNTCDSLAPPTVVLMKLPASEQEQLKKVWEFKCPVKDLTEEQVHKQEKGHFGTAMELPDKNIFVSTCSPYGTIFIVNRNKNILFRAVTEKFDENKKEWQTSSTYRASFVPSKKELEMMIWFKK